MWNSFCFQAIWLGKKFKKMFQQPVAAGTKENLFFCQSFQNLPHSWGLFFLSKFPEPATFLELVLFFKSFGTCHVFWDLYFFQIFLKPATFLVTCTFFRVPITCHVSSNFSKVKKGVRKITTGTFFFGGFMNLPRFYVYE